MNAKDKAKAEKMLRDRGFTNKDTIDMLLKILTLEEIERLRIRTYVSENIVYKYVYFKKKS